MVVREKINRVFVDPGSSVDVIFKETLDDLKIRNLHMKGTQTLLQGFRDNCVMLIEA